MDRIRILSKVMYHLRRLICDVNVFLDFEPAPSTEQLMKGTEQMRSFEPRCYHSSWW